MKSALKGLLVAIVATMFWAFVFEAGARFWVGFAGDPLDRARLVLEPNVRYLWRVRPGFEGRFEGAKLTTDSNGFRHTDANPDWILLGPSSAFGWGVEESKTYFSLAAKSENTKYSNLSQIGYGISQGRRLFDDHRAEWKSRARVVFLAYGVNDVDRFRFFGPSGSTDDEVFADPTIAERLLAEYWLYRAAFPALLMRRLQEATFGFGCPPTKFFATRTSNESFLSTLEQLVTDVSSDGHRAVLLNSPFRYPFEVQKNLATEAELQFRAAASLAGNGQCREAREAFAKARIAEPHRVALAIENLNSAMKAESVKRGWTLVDIAGPLNSDSDFVDPIHFSKAGHLKVESAIRERLHPNQGSRP